MAAKSMYLLVIAVGYGSIHIPRLHQFGLVRSKLTAGEARLPDSISRLKRTAIQNNDQE
jgi:hypothetical protein